MTKANKEPKCEAQTTTLYIKVRERDGKKKQLTCVRVARYRVGTKCLCQSHAGLLCLELSLNGIVLAVEKIP